MPNDVLSYKTISTSPPKMKTSVAGATTVSSDRLVYGTNPENAVEFFEAHRMPQLEAILLSENGLTEEDTLKDWVRVVPLEGDLKQNEAKFVTIDGRVFAEELHERFCNKAQELDLGRREEESEDDAKNRLTAQKKKLRIDLAEVLLDELTQPLTFEALEEKAPEITSRMSKDEFEVNALQKQIFIKQFCNQGNATGLVTGDLSVVAGMHHMLFNTANIQIQIVTNRTNPSLGNGVMVTVTAETNKVGMLSAVDGAMKKIHYEDTLPLLGHVVTFLYSPDKVTFAEAKGYNKYLQIIDYHLRCLRDDIEFKHPPIEFLIEKDKTVKRYSDRLDQALADEIKRYDKPPVSTFLSLFHRWIPPQASKVLADEKDKLINVFCAEYLSVIDDLHLYDGDELLAKLDDIHSNYELLNVNIHDQEQIKLGEKEQPKDKHTVTFDEAHSKVLADSKSAIKQSRQAVAKLIDNVHARLSEIATEYRKEEYSSHPFKRISSSPSPQP